MKLKSNKINYLPLTFKETFISLIDHKTPLKCFFWSNLLQMDYVTKNEWIWMNELTIDRMNETRVWREQMDRIALNNPLCIDNSVSKYK